MEDVIQVWCTFENWLSENIPSFTEGLNVGATNPEWEKITKVTGIVFPNSFQKIYNLHNGQSNNYSGIFPEGIMLQINEIIRHWSILKELESQGYFNSIVTEASLEIQPKWWIEKWVPVVSNGSGDFLCIDFEPSENGRIGQLISFDHNSLERKIVAFSYSDWFRKTVIDLIDGKYKFVHKTGEFEKNN